MATLEPPSDLPTRALSKLRRPRKEAGKSDSASSLLDVSDDSNVNSSSIRASIDGAIEKLKDRRRKSTDEQRRSLDASTRRSKLSGLSRPSRRRSTSKPATAAIASAADQLALPGRSDRLSTSPSRSELELGFESSGHSSLMTDDSDNEGDPTRPTLSPHQSHAGYLTLSNPLINAQPASPPTDASAANDTPVVDPATSLHPADSSNNTILDPAFFQPTQGHEHPSAQGPPSREPSEIPRKQPSPAGDSDSPSSLGSGRGGLGSLFGGKNRSDSLLVDRTTGSTERLPQTTIDKINPRASAPSTPKFSPGPKPLIITPSTPPNLVSTPTTFVTPPTPTLPQLPAASTSPPKTNAPDAKSPPTSVPSSPALLNSTTLRRKRTGTLTSSKLSNTITASPLTPHIEESKTPGGTLTAPTGPGGFFSTVFSAAQNAANQLSHSINSSITQNQKANKPTLPDPKAEDAGGEEVIPGPDFKLQSDDAAPGAKRQLAVETLGKGDLSLSHLGITEDSDPSPMNSQTDLSGTAQSQSPEESAVGRAVSVAYEKPFQSAMSQATGGRPSSVVSAEGSEAGIQTPPRPSTALDGLKRAGSVKSKLSDRRRRGRGSSNGTLNAAATASTVALVNPGATGPGHRLTGFAIASSKRNKDFHQTFRSVPEDDYLIEDYSAALQRDILLHGRLYVSEGHICFSSNILGWVTNLVISFDEIVSMEKKSTAVIFPNAIVIQTLHARNVFASFVARDSTYDLLVGIWKISHPNLKSSLNGVLIEDAGTGDKTEKAGSVASDDASGEGSEDEVYDEDEDDGDDNSFYEPTMAGSVAGSDVVDATLSRKASTAPMPSPPGQQMAAAMADVLVPVPNPPPGQDFLGPAIHSPTECTDTSAHYSNQLTDITIPAPLGKVYSLMWGAQSSTFMKTFLVDNQKSRELELPSAGPAGLDGTHRELVYSYIKPLNAPVGPRQTKCIVTAKLEDFDLEKAVSVGCSTATPDVPSGSVFETKTRYCLMWGPGNSTRFIASCTVEWTGKSWLKSPIEKGANDGQIQYVKDLTAALRAAVVAKPPTVGRTAGKKGRSRRKDKDASEQAEAVATVAAAKIESKADWGLFEPLRGPLEPFTSILGPIFTPQVIVGILLFLLAYSWIFPGRGRSSGNGLGFPITTPDRLAAYEEIWRREESELWDWLEDRVGLQDGVPISRQGYSGHDSDKRNRQKLLKVKSMGKKLRDLSEDRFSQVQVDDALRVTEERLEALKVAVEHRKSDA